MKSRFTRRNLIQASSLLLAPATWPRLLRAAQVPLGAVQGPTPGLAHFNYAYVGTYTPNGGGIYLFRLDPATAALTQLQIVDDIRNPTWLAINPAQTRLYAVSEIDNFQGKHGGAVVSYAIDAGSLQLKRLGAVSSGGITPAHASVHPSGKFVFVANYGGGSVAVFPVGDDGALGEATDVRPSVGQRHHVRGANDPPGQFAVSDHDGPHLHMVAPDPSGQFVIANDAGLDLTLVWRFDAAAGRLLPANVPVIPAPPGSAPRHFVFHPNGRLFYNLYEHDGKVAVYDYDAARGGLKLKQVVSSLPPKFEGSNLSSEIVMTADGRFLYVANRLHNAVAIFAVAGDGQLRITSEAWVHADSPRSLCIDPGGSFLYSCNQRGDSITSFHLNATSGALTFTGRFEAVGSPAVMTILNRS
ncbi:MAG: lactonase family protein [Pseudomonadota bacterium]|nr:lactonase family protein [Pseudomonadota bacterium]